jgi:hypothetical protein
MREAVPPLPQYAFMAWCSVKAQGQLYILSLPVVVVVVVVVTSKKERRL